MNVSKSVTRTSQQDIAQIVGVSQAIVSGVLNDKPVRVSSATREKIISTALDLGYRKSQPSKRPPDIIAFVTHDEHWDKLLLIMRGMNKFLTNSNTLVVPHEWRGGENAEQLFNNAIGCVSVSAEMALRREDLNQMSERMPLLFIHIPDDMGMFDAVVSDPTIAFKHALRHLWKLGHRGFGYFGIRKMSSPQACRTGSFLTAILDLDYPLPERGWLHTPSRKAATDIDTKQRISEYITALLESTSMPTAIFFESSGYAEFFKEQALEHGIRVPEDISIVAYLDSGAHQDISCITIPWEQMGYMAAKALKDRINNPQQPIMEYRLGEQWSPGNSIAQTRKSYGEVIGRLNTERE